MTNRRSVLFNNRRSRRLPVLQLDAPFTTFRSAHLWEREQADCTSLQNGNVNGVGPSECLAEGSLPPAGTGPVELPITLKAETLAFLSADHSW